MKYTWLLFDADDTLFDFPRAESNALKWTMEGSGLPFRQEYSQVYDAFNAQVWDEFERGELSSQELRLKRFSLFLAETGLRGDVEAISQRYLHNLAQGVDLLEGAEEVVYTLRKTHHLALVTNGLMDVQRPRLEGSNLSGSFEQVFISEELGAAKPAAAFFDIVFARLGQPARNSVLIIGDSLTSDMQGGIDYGIDTCWFNPAGKPSSLPVTYQIARLTELLELLSPQVK